MINEIFADMKTSYKKGVFGHRTSFYFSIDEVKKTIIFDGEGYAVEDGKTVEDADCVCKTDKELFRKIWFEGYQPGMKDFFSGAIKSNAPQLLQQFMQAFGKS